MPAVAYRIMPACLPAPAWLQVMSLIAYLMEKKSNYGPHLIIVPNAVLVNWKAELTLWLPSVRCVYYTGNKVRGRGVFCLMSGRLSKVGMGF